MHLGNFDLLLVHNNTDEHFYVIVITIFLSCRIYIGILCFYTTF